MEKKEATSKADAWWANLTPAQKLDALERTVYITYLYYCAKEKQGA